LAVGDAAIAFDPLSGQGVYGALESGMLGAKAIQDHVNGINGAFEEYGQARKKSLAEYLRLRRAFYAEEQRWPHAAFWQRRI
jgi:flavin-dependent dehydrogenase